MGDKYNSHVDPAPTFERFIDLIINRVKRCEKHPKPSDGVPCYMLHSDKPQIIRFGVCNWRARQAGFVGDKPAFTSNKK